MNGLRGEIGLNGSKGLKVAMSAWRSQSDLHYFIVQGMMGDPGSKGDRGDIGDQGPMGSRVRYACSSNCFVPLRHNNQCYN